MIKKQPDTSASPRSRSALQDSSTSSSSTDNDDLSVFKENSYPFKAKSNNNNNYEKTDFCTTKEYSRGKYSNEQTVTAIDEKISSHEDIDIDELFRTDKSLPSIVFFPSSSRKK